MNALLPLDPGREEGGAQARREIARLMLAEGFTPEQVAKATGLPPAEPL